MLFRVVENVRRKIVKRPRFSMTQAFIDAPSPLADGFRFLYLSQQKPSALVLLEKLFDKWADIYGYRP